MSETKKWGNSPRQLENSFPEKMMPDEANEREDTVSHAGNSTEK